MRENKYDDESFFNKYKEFPRSVNGLNGAGEWHEMQRLMPDLKGKRVLDLGCGFGWHALYAADQGASYVLGVDISENMLAVAKEKNTFLQVEYKRMAMEDIDFEDNSFDVVISSLALHYIAHFEDISKKVYNLLTKNGDFMFSVEHPVFTAEGTQNWIYSKSGNAIYWPVDYYFEEGERRAIFLGEEVTKYHRTLTTYINGLITAGFTIKGVVEPKPSQKMLEMLPQMREELRRPMMLIVSASK